MASASTPSAVDLAKTNCSNVKNNKKITFFSGEMLFIGICYVVIASICSEKTRKKKSRVPTLYRECYHTLIKLKKSQEFPIFVGLHKISSST